MAIYDSFIRPHACSPRNSKADLEVSRRFGGFEKEQGVFAVRKAAGVFALASSCDQWPRATGLRVRTTFGRVAGRTNTLIRASQSWDQDQRGNWRIATAENRWAWDWNQGLAKARERFPPSGHHEWRDVKSAQKGVADFALPTMVFSRQLLKNRRPFTIDPCKRRAHKAAVKGDWISGLAEQDLLQRRRSLLRLKYLGEISDSQTADLARINDRLAANSVQRLERRHATGEHISFRQNLMLIKKLTEALEKNLSGT